MNLRQPVRAGSFYEATPTSCKHHACKLIEAVTVDPSLPKTVYGGLVPHAGWVYSGPLAAKTLKTLLSSGKVHTVVLLGADHCGTVRTGEVYDSGVWRTPIGDVPINENLAAALVKASPLLRANAAAHDNEHSLEVQIPLLQAIDPAIKIVPIGVPPDEKAVAIGQAVGGVLAGEFPGVVVVGSSDLTHHGGHFPSPGGSGITGVKWTEANDRRMLDLIEKMRADEIVAEAHQHINACGAGAIAATTAACKAMGATKGLCLGYTNSYRIIHQQYPDEPDETTVGYASVVFA